MEEWKVIPAHPKYEVSNLGNVRRIKSKRLLKHSFNAGGYPQVTFSVGNHSLTTRECRSAGLRKSATIAVHVIVMSAFIGPTPTGMVIMHKDEIKLNPVLANLQFGTHRQNVLAYYANRRILKGPSKIS